MIRNCSCAFSHRVSRLESGQTRGPLLSCAVISSSSALTMWTPSLRVPLKPQLIVCMSMGRSWVGHDAYSYCFRNETLDSWIIYIYKHIFSCHKPRRQKNKDFDPCLIPCSLVDIFAGKKLNPIHTLRQIQAFSEWLDNKTNEIKGKHISLPNNVLGPTPAVLNLPSVATL